MLVARHDDDDDDDDDDDALNSSISNDSVQSLDLFDP